MKLVKYPGLIFEAKDLNLNSLPMSDCHLHTSWTDGEASVGEVYRMAVEVGLETILLVSTVEKQVLIGLRILLMK